MKYWLLTTEYPPQFGGGIGTYCYQWAQQLTRENADVTVFLVNRNVSSFRETVYDGVRVIEFSAYLANTSSFLGFETTVSASFEKIVNLFIQKEGAPDWIEAQDYNGIAYYLLQKKHLGYDIYQTVKIVINCHCPSFIAFEFNHVNTYQLPYFWIGEMERFCIKAADICISPSQYLVDILLERYPQLNRKFDVLKNPMNVDQLTKSSTRSFSGEAVVIGKLSPIKGILESLKIFSRLWDDGSKYKLKLLGDGYYYYHALGTMMKPYIENKYSKYIDKGLLTMTGLLHPEKMQTMINNADFVFVPSRFDNFPYAVLEVMAQQKVVVAADSGGHYEILQDGKNGFTYRSGSINDAIEKIRYAFSMDAVTAAEMGANARKTVEEECDPKRYYKQKMKLLGAFDPVAGNRQFPFISVGSKLCERRKDEKEGLLSVIIPYYNMGIYIEETITSIKASGYTSLEIIIVDDGSREQPSLDVLEKLKKDAGLVIVHQPNKGLASTRNEGARLAKGEFLAFLDADDKIDPNYYSHAIRIMEEKINIHFVGCWTKYFGESNNTWPAFNPEPPYLLYHNMVNSSSLVFRRASYLQHGLNDPEFVFGMEDYDSVISMVKNKLPGVVIPETYFWYRVRKNSMARGFNKSNMNYLYGLLARKHKDFYATFAAEIASLLNANGPGYECENPTIDYHIYPSASTQNIFIRKIILAIKRNPRLRKIALSVYKRFK